MKFKYAHGVHNFKITYDKKINHRIHMTRFDVITNHSSCIS
jgi:hypothetical protein